MPSPYLCERYHPTRGCSQRKSLFLNFANENAKAAPPGFERETRGNLSSHTVKIISDTHKFYWMASNYLLGSQIRNRGDFRLLIMQ